MNEIIEFLKPETLQDTPRLFTGIAEWMGVFVNYLLYKRKHNGIYFVMICIGTFVAQVLFHVLAGMAPLSFWIPNMLLAVGIMYVALLVELDVPRIMCGFLCVTSFLMAEFSASLYRQLYFWFAQAKTENILVSCVMMLVVYMVSFGVYFGSEKKKVVVKSGFKLTGHDMYSALATVIGVFSLSNLSFIWHDTPFSVSATALLYVRTLVDLGGVLMLLNQKSRITEMSVAQENAAINRLFRSQYEQYRLSIDNSELLRKEIHDLKHYLVALKNETDPARKAEYFEELEQEIAVQESFQNTGNSVLDVILTNKSLQCKKAGITLSAMVDGDVLSFMHVKDICALIGNILDNAIEATRQAVDPEKRLVSLSIKSKNNFVIVECENHCERDLELSGRFHLPQTTKSDRTVHGYGLKSIRQVAEKYNGSMTMSQNGEWVTIKVLMSVSKE